MKFAWRTKLRVLPDQKVTIQTLLQSNHCLIWQQYWLSHSAVLHSWCSFRLRYNPFFEIWIWNHYPRQFNIPQKKLMSWAEHDKTLQETITFTDKRLQWLQKQTTFNLVIQIQEALWRILSKRPEILNTRKKSFMFQKRSKKMLWHWGANLADQNKQQPQKINMHLTYHPSIYDLSVWNKPLIDTCQYCLTSQANQALRSLANTGFQNSGVCLQAFPSFLPSPPPPRSFIFWLSFHFLRG